MTQIKWTGGAPQTVEGVGVFEPGQPREVSDGMAMQLLLCDGFEAETVGDAPRPKKTTKRGKREDDDTPAPTGDE